MKQEAQVILMAAGPGSRMSTVGFRSKCLLPVGNFPMIYHSLHFLQKTGFSEVTIIVKNGEEGEIAKLSEQFGLKIRLDIAPVDTSDDPGTAESLRRIQSKIKKNVEEVIIMSCDMITDFTFTPMMNEHRSKGAAMTILTADKQPDFIKTTPPGPKMKTTLNNDIICKETTTNRLVYYVAGGDYDNFVKIASRAVDAVENTIELKSDFIDGHLFIMKRWLIDYILHKNSPCSKLGSLKAEVVPRIIADQFSKNDQNYTIKSTRYEDLIRKYNTSLIPSRFNLDSSVDERACYAFHHPGFLVRINTMGNLWQINMRVKELYEKTNLSNLKERPPEDVNPKAQICEETIIGRSTQISARTNLKRCVIGSHCHIKPLVRIVDSVLFDYVNVAEGCVIENSLICVNVDFKCTIKNCVLADSTKIEENETYQNELLEVSQVYTD